VETATFGSEFIAARTTIDQNTDKHSWSISMVLILSWEMAS
jgi:hypothetical protein